MAFLSEFGHTLNHNSNYIKSLSQPLILEADTETRLFFYISVGLLQLCVTRYICVGHDVFRSEYIHHHQFIIVHEAQERCIISLIG